MAIESKQAPLLAVENITLQYGPVIAVRECSLKVGKGEFVTLVGTNGAGKSSILGAIAGLHPITSGRIEFKERDVSNEKTSDLVRLGIALCPEGRGILSQMSVEENLLLGAYSKRVGLLGNLDRVYQLFPILKERKGQLSGSLSGGQQQMLSIGRGLMSEPQLLLLDEPSLGLAPIVVEEIFAAVSQLCLDGMSVLVSEEGTKPVFSYASRAFVIKTGRIDLSGTVDSVQRDPRLADAFFGR